MLLKLKMAILERKYSELIHLGQCPPNIAFILRERTVNFDMQDVFYLDALPSSHPISVNIENPVYQENFDRKGGRERNIFIADNI